MLVTSLVHEANHIVVSGANGTLFEGFSSDAAPKTAS